MTDPDPWARHLNYKPEPAPTVVLPRRRALVLAAVVVVTVLVAGVALVLAMLAARDDAPSAAPAASSSAPVVAGIARAVDGRDYFVGTDLEPGVYVQAAETPACAWRVSDPITDETIVEGRPGTGLATVNLGPDTKFRADGCGPWVDAP